MVGSRPPSVYDRRSIAGGGVVDGEWPFGRLAEVHRRVGVRVAEGGHRRVRLLLLVLMLLLLLLLLLLRPRQGGVVRRAFLLNKKN